MFFFASVVFAAFVLTASFTHKDVMQLSRWQMAEYEPVLMFLWKKTKQLQGKKNRPSGRGIEKDVS